MLKESFQEALGLTGAHNRPAEVTHWLADAAERFRTLMVDVSYCDVAAKALEAYLIDHGFGTSPAR
jgi:hypothetical protein